MSRDFEDHCWRDVIPAEDMHIYRRYRRETKVGPNAAVLAIDLYNKAYFGGRGPIAKIDEAYPGAIGDAAWDAIVPTQRLLAAARKAGMPIIYSTAPGSDGGLRATKRSRIPVESDLDPWAIKAEFKPEPDDLIVIKECASVFYGTPLQAYLQRMSIDSLIVCGESTSGCVRASVVDAYSGGFHVVVAEECTFDRSSLIHKVSLFDLHHKYADVMHLEDILADFASRERSGGK